MTNSGKISLENKYSLDPSYTPQNSMANGGNYEIVVQGHLDADWVEWFNNLKIAHDGSGNTILSGYVVDQPALHGILSVIRDLGLFLVSLKYLNN